MSSKLAPIFTILKEEELIGYVMDAIQAISNEAIASRGIFRIGFSGGSLINLLADEHGLRKLNTNWKQWRIFLCDERIVKEDDPECIFGSYKKALFSKIDDFPLENFLGIDLELDKDGSIEGIANGYEKKLKELWKGEQEESVSFGMADCLLLGVGPDGHTCSLFPNHKTLNVMDSWITIELDSPKLPSKRITITYPFINKAAHIFVIGIGQSKLQIVKKIQEGEDLPIGRIHNPGGHLEWIIGTKSS